MEWAKKIFNTAWHQGQIREGWGKAIVCPIHETMKKETLWKLQRNISFYVLKKLHSQILQEQLPFFKLQSIWKKEEWRIHMKTIFDFIMEERSE